MTRLPPVDFEVSAYTVPTDAPTVPTDAPEADGTLEWTATTMVLVQARPGALTGLGWTYGPAAITDLIVSLLVPALAERDGYDVAAAHEASAAPCATPAGRVPVRCPSRRWTAPFGIPNARHIEWFHDHARIESMFFDGTLDPTGGAIRPRDDTPGIGLCFKHADARPYRVR